VIPRPSSEDEQRVSNTDDDDDDDEIYFGQGCRYTLWDQGTFCLAQGRAACSETTTGVGKYYSDGRGICKYGLRRYAAQCYYCRQCM